MTMKVSLLILLCSSLTLTGFIAPYTSAEFAQEQDTDQAEELKKEARKKFMRGKLNSNQQIVEGLSLKNFDLIGQGAQGVTALVKGQHWFVLDTPEYRDHSKQMESAANRLHEASKAKNIEAAALRYFDLTLSCIDCHEHDDPTQVNGVNGHAAISRSR